MNVLSYSNSADIMRRIESVALAWLMVRFIKLDDYVKINLIYIVTDILAIILLLIKRAKQLRAINASCFND
jgi:hypothetical protein